VGMLLPNDYGLFDVYGNATEWCNDTFAPYAATATVDVGGPDPNQRNLERVLRGLAAGDVADPRSALRDRGLYTVTTPAIGFRVARTEPREQTPARPSTLVSQAVGDTARASEP
jgi:formylglycine-generating enzyme